MFHWKEKRKLKKLTKEKDEMACELRRAAMWGYLDKTISILQRCHNDLDVVNMPAYNMQHKPGATPLILAARHMHPEIVRLLLNVKNIDVAAVDHDVPAINVPGVPTYYPNPRTVRGIDYFRNNALHAALGRQHVRRDSREPDEIKKQLEVVKLLVEHHDTHINAVCASGKSALILAIQYCPEAVPMILKVNGVKVNIVDDDKKSALYYAVEEKSKYISTLLAIQEIDVDAADKNGWTPLMLAAKAGDKETTLKLIDAEATVNLANKVGSTAADIAALYGHEELAVMLKSHEPHHVMRKG